MDPAPRSVWGLARIFAIDSFRTFHTRLEEHISARHGILRTSVKERDDNWFQLPSGQLNESKSLFWGYYAYGDSILLANTIFIIRRTIRTFSGPESHHRNDITEASKKTFELICRFDILILYQSTSTGSAICGTNLWTRHETIPTLTLHRFVR